MVENRSSWHCLRLSTERLHLRPWDPGDVGALHGLFADPEIMRALGRHPVSRREETQAIVDDGIGTWETEGMGPFVLETAEPGGQVVGQAGIMIYDTRGWTASTWADAGHYAQPELGWALIRAHWGRGYATEAAAAIRDWAYTQPSVRRLVSLISTDNIRSQRVAERIGAVASEPVTPREPGRSATVWRYPRP